MVVQKTCQGAKDSYAYSYPINFHVTSQQALPKVFWWLTPNKFSVFDVYPLL